MITPPREHSSRTGLSSCNRDQLHAFSIGSAYVQLFRHFGVAVTAVCRRQHLELVRSLGAERCIDYETEEFTAEAARFDYVFDAVGQSSFSRCRPLLTERGTYAGSRTGDVLWAILAWRSRGKRVLLTALPDLKAVLQFVSETIAAGGLRPVIDRTYRLEDIGQAFQHVASGDKVGSVVVRMAA